MPSETCGKDVGFAIGNHQMRLMLGGGRRLFDFVSVDPAVCPAGGGPKPRFVDRGFSRHECFWLPSAEFFRRVSPESLSPLFRTPWFSSQSRRRGFWCGIFLDGREAFVASDFPGIGGSSARTVAMWVRLPEDGRPETGYSLASGGSHEGLGAAWQMSVNPGFHGGHTGHLRVGTYHDYAIGNTDINCKKAVALQLGRDLISSVEKYHFRGWIDEVVVADEALTQSQIRQLMRENRIR